MTTATRDLTTFAPPGLAPSARRRRGRPRRPVRRAWRARRSGGHPDAWGGAPAPLAVARELAEVLSKAVPLVAGTVYLAGYLVTAERLADYGVSVTQLVNAQYFIAGVAPGALFWLTVLVGRSAYRRGALRADRGAQGRVGLVVLALFGVLFVLDVAGVTIARFTGRRVLGPQSWFDVYVGTLLRVALAQAGLWYLIHGLRTRLFLELGRSLRHGRHDSGVAQATLFVIFLAAAMMYRSYRESVGVYAAIPQAYGGARPLRARLYVERSGVPAELLAGGAGDAGERSARAYTLPVDLVFQTSDAFIVDPLHDGGRRGWTVYARAVHAVLPEAGATGTRPSR
jgi:hypothetical protein